MTDAARPGAGGASEAAMKPAQRGGRACANAWMLEPIPRISPCTSGATDRLRSPVMLAIESPLNVEPTGANCPFGNSCPRLVREVGSAESAGCAK